jgi:hypothetical protein
MVWNWIILGIVSIGALLAGNTFLKTTTQTLSPTNPVLWVIGGIALIFLLTKSGQGSSQVYVIGR